MSHLAAIARLRRVADALAAGRLPSPEDASAHALCLVTYITGTCGLPDALGLACQPGQRDARNALASDRRNDYVRKAAKYFPRADDLHDFLQRYAATGWLKESHLQTCPSHRLGKPEELAWCILHERDHVLSARQIRAIISAVSSGYSPPKT